MLDSNNLTITGLNGETFADAMQAKLDALTDDRPSTTSARAQTFAGFDDRQLEIASQLSRIGAALINATMDNDLDQIAELREERVYWQNEQLEEGLAFANRHFPAKE